MPLAVERMIRDGNRAGDVIQRLRALTKKTDPQNAPLDINDVINDVVGLVLREVLSHRVRLKRDLVTALNRIIGDRVQLQQVIINLVANCIEAMANVAGRPRELIINERVLVLVRDSDVGIDAEMLDYSMPSSPPKLMVWAWDYRSADPSSKRMAESCGLPPTTRWAFQFTVPFVHVAESGPGACHHAIPRPSEEPMVFVVDDDPSLREAAEQPATIGGFTRRTVWVRA